MKEFLLLIMGLVLLTCYSGAQVIANFDTTGNLEGFAINDAGSGGGEALDSLYQASNPTKRSPGMLVMHLNFIKADSGVCSLSKSIDPEEAQLLTFRIYIPGGENIPDSMAIEIYAEDNIYMQAQETVAYVKDIPRDTWYPLSLQVTQLSIKNPQFDLANGHISRTGIKISNAKAADGNWSGYIYIDDVYMIGSHPFVYADFKTSASGFAVNWNNGWVSSVAQISGPVGGSTGILEFKLSDGSKKTAGTAAGVEPTGGVSAFSYYFMAVWVYIDSTFPNAGYIQAFAQDNNLWEWPEPRGITTYNGIDIPKNVWYPLYFDLAQATIMDVTPGSSFNSLKYPLGKFGIQVDAPSDWKGSVYIDKLQFLNVYVPPKQPKWVAANFDDAANGLQGFYVPSNYADGNISRTSDTKTSNKTYIMKAEVDFSLPHHLFAIMNDNVPPLLDYKDPNKYATKTSFDIYLPLDMPYKAIVKFVINGNATGSEEIETDYKVGGTMLNAESWNTIYMDLDSLVQSGFVNLSKTSQLGVTINYPGDTVTWAGTIYFDNLIFYGIEKSEQLVKTVENNYTVKEFKLYNNYPNPFNPSTKIKYDIPKESNVTIKVYDTLGREVATLVNERQKPGTYALNFNALQLASGMYIYRITAKNFVQSHKMILLK